MEMNAESIGASTLPSQDNETSFSFVSWLLSSSVLTMAILAVVSWMIYVSWSPAPERRQQVTTAEAREGLQRQQRRQRPAAGASAGNLSAGGASRWLSASATAVLTNCQTFPPHVSVGPEDISSSTTTKGNSSSIGGNNILTDGIVGFRHTKAASILPTKLSKDTDGSKSATMGVEIDVVKVRKERARLLSRLLSSATTTSQKQPPQVLRGSIVVVAVPREDVGCDRLKHILFLLATYFNVFVLVHVPDKDTSTSSTITMSQVLHERDAIISKLWSKPTTEGSSEDSGVNLSHHHLNESILPGHRIIVTSSTAGRVAFCRQMEPQRVQVVVDFEGAVKTQLNRFGYSRVFCYNYANSSISGLANSLEWNVAESA